MGDFAIKVGNLTYGGNSKTWEISNVVKMLRKLGKINMGWCKKVILNMVDFAKESESDDGVL